MRPEKWNLKALFLVSIVMGYVACVSSLVMLWACLDSHNPDGVFARWNLPPMEYGKIVTAVYLKVGSPFCSGCALREGLAGRWGS